MQATETQTGGCYCSAVRFAITAAPLVKGQCHCRACQHMAGGAPQYFLLVPPTGFAWTQGQPRTYTRQDIENAVTRYFCPDCGTQLVTVRQDNPAFVVKVGVLDDPSEFKPRVAICHAQAQSFHHVPDGIPVFDDLPTG
ncbi:GFA family protein [Tateyamaria sp. syn59]|uniref:GFA family protein n=1 Tax=Tateyamaria sp. syn59 TaxID=2576942 RepID=UPI0011BEF22C|nr:GFA family protein [Tateyamaria sp. syn59]